MLSKHIRISIRNILKQKGYNLLNTIGLAIGIGSGLIISLHIQDELSYEKSFDNYKNIYRVHDDAWAKSSPPLAQEFKDAMTEVVAIGRFGVFGIKVLDTKNNNPGEAKGFYADSTIVDVFGFKILEGDRKQALATPETVVLTKSTSRRYFGDVSSVGKVIKLDNTREFIVTNVIEDLAVNSHLKFDFLVSMQTYYKDFDPTWTNHRGWFSMYTYCRFKSSDGPKKVEARMPQFIRKFFEYLGKEQSEEQVRKGEIKIMPIEKIHLYSNLEKEMTPNSSILNVYILSAVEIMILLIASANLLSLFTTQAIMRMKEIGLRKLLGAGPTQLMGQFLTEITLISLSAVLLAFLFYYVLALPFYSDIMGKTFGVMDVFTPKNCFVLLALLLTIILISGLYPIYFISKFKAGSFMKENKLPNSMPNKLRSGLVIFQFVISVCLISASILVKQQLGLMRNKELGFDKEQVVNIKLYGTLKSVAINETASFKNEFLKNPDVLAVGRAGMMMGENFSVESILPVGNEKYEDKIPASRVLRVDEDFLKVMGIEMVGGRNFSLAFNDSSSSIINESAVKALMLDNPLGAQLKNLTRSTTDKIVGVVKDFHFASLRNKIEPLVIENRPKLTTFMAVQITTGQT